MREMATLGLDLANNVFQLHTIDAEGKLIDQPTTPRRRTGIPQKSVPAPGGTAACGTANHRRREIGGWGKLWG
jgi:transposase